MLTERAKATFYEFVTIGSFTKGPEKIVKAAPWSGAQYLVNLKALLHQQVAIL